VRAVSEVHDGSCCEDCQSDEPAAGFDKVKSDLA